MVVYNTVPLSEDARLNEPKAPQNRKALIALVAAVCFASEVAGATAAPSAVRRPRSLRPACPAEVTSQATQKRLPPALPRPLPCKYLNVELRLLALTNVDRDKGGQGRAHRLGEGAPLHGEGPVPLVDVVRVRRRPGPVLALGIGRGPVLADLDGLEPPVVHAQQEGHAVAHGRPPAELRVRRVQEQVAALVASISEEGLVRPDEAVPALRARPPRQVDDGAS